MAFSSMKFLLFLLGAVCGYYLIPRRFQWIWLLVFSYIYYLASGGKLVVFLLFTTLTTYGLARLIAGSGEDKKGKRRILILGLLLNFGMLGVIKYTNLAVTSLNQIPGMELPFVHFLLPLGISFYTFQSMGYLMDVYWGRMEAEKNPFRFALFVSFFPQIMQGPIGRYSRLAGQLYECHTFDWTRIERGLQLMLWGFFKKMVLADNAALFVNVIFDEYQSYPGLSAAGVLLYSIQLYGDFSGAMDVVMGVAGLFGIQLDENFRRPYFARSITDFWHRWHITLGTWMKDYIFYPFSLSRGMSRFGKFARKKFGKQLGRTLPICIANLVVFLVVGIWHGAAWKFIAYGMYNGLIIGISGLLAKQYRSWKKKLGINDKSAWFAVFQILRTFLLVNVSWFFDRADTVGQAFTMFRNACSQMEWSGLLQIPTTAGGSGYTKTILFVLFLGCLILFAVSLLQERGIRIRETLSKQPLVLRFAVYLALLFSLSMMGQMPLSSGGFIYAQF